MTERFWIEPGSALDRAIDAAAGQLNGITPTPEQVDLITGHDRADLRVAQRIAMGARGTCRMIAGITACPDDPRIRERWYGGIVGRPAPHTPIGEFLEHLGRLGPLTPPAGEP